VILRSLRIEGVRRFRNPVELTDMGVGAHVVYAPNEVGKSTLFTAVARALCDKYSTHGSDIEEMRPWGTSLSPLITLELEVAGKRYRLRKRFLTDAESLLDEWTGAGYERLADAQQADDLARSYIEGTASLRGSTSIGHWGIAQLLWIPQDPVRTALPTFSEPLRQRLLTLVGATSFGPQELALTKKIEAAFGIYFTPTGRALKGNALSELEQRRSALSEEQQKWQQAIQDAALNADQIAAAEQDLAGFTTESKSLRGQLAELKERATIEAELEKQSAAKRSDWTRLKDRFASSDGLKRTLAGLVEKSARARTSAAELLPKRDDARLAVEQEAKKRAEAEDGHSAARAETTEAERRHERARTVEKALKLVDEQRRLSELVVKAERITAMLAQKAADADSPAPADADVKKAEGLEKEIAQLQAKLEAIGLEVVFTPDGAASVSWKTFGDEEQRQPAAGECVVFRGADAGTLTIAGVGAIQIRSGAEGVSEIQEKLVARKAELSRRLGEWQVKELAKLRELREAAQTRAQEISSLEEKHSDILTGDHADLASARGALAKVSGQLAELLEPLGLDRLGLDAEKGVDAKRLASEVKTAKAKLVAREEEAKKAAATVRQAELRADKLESERAGFEREANTLDAQHAAAVTANGSMEFLSSETERLAGEAALAEAASKALEAKLPPAEQRAHNQLRRVEDALDGLAQKEKGARDRLSRSKALLERAGAEGAYSRLCEAEEKIALLDAELARESRKAAAAKLLWELTAAQRENASRSLVDPVEKQVQLRLGYLRGQGASPFNLSFAEGLDELDIGLPGGERAPFQSLSWGTQEQTMFALRLALGAMFSREGKEPQLVVLDDALVNTDALRHGRALDLVQSAAEQMQVVILTAFPERYRTLKAKEYDLVALAAGR